MKRSLRLLLLLIPVWFCTTALPAFFPLSDSMISSAAAQEWKTEFDDVCRKTTDAMALSKDELKLLLARCDKLRTVMGTLDETEKKVYLKRLKLCQELFAFVLESKEKQ